MSVQDDEINLMDLWKVVVKRKTLIISISFLLAILALALSLMLPKVYEGGAVVALPKVGISFVETKAVTESFIKAVKKKNPIDGLDEDLIKRINDIEIDQIKGSETQFKVTVRIKDEPQKAKDVINKVLAYLNRNEYVQRRMNIEKAAIEANIAETKRTIDIAQITRNDAIRFISVRNPVGFNPGDLDVRIKDLKASIISTEASLGFNPVDLDVRIKDLKASIISMETSLALLKGYEFVSGPYAYKKKVSPKVSLNTIIAGMAGLFIGLLSAFLMESVEKQRKEGV